MTSLVASVQSANTLGDVLGGFAADQLVEHFAALTEAPRGVEAMRRFVLDLARSGRLARSTEALAPDGFQCADWQWISVATTFEALSTQGKKVLTASVSETGKHPVVDQGQLLVRGYVDDDSCVIHPPRAVVVFGDHTRVVKFIDFPFVPGADGTKILLPREDIEPRFFFWMLKSLPIEARGYGRHFARLLEHRIPVPPLAEQKLIVAKVDQLMALCDELEARLAKKRDISNRLTKSALQALTTAEGPEEFDAAWKRVVENFDVLIDRAEKVVEVRGVVFDLAVRGRLTGSESPGLTSGAPFAVPARWRWSRMGEEFDIVGGIQKTPLRTPRSAHYAYLRVENVQRGKLNLERIERFELLPNELEKWRLERDDLLIVEGNGSEKEIGRCALWTAAIPDCVHQNHLIRCRALGQLAPAFAIVFLNSPSGMAAMKALAITTSGLFSLSVGKVRSVDVPVPPLAEQKLIVAKVEQLMKVCDELEARLTRAEDRAAKLVEAVVQELVA